MQVGGRGRRLAKRLAAVEMDAALRLAPGSDGDRDVDEAVDGTQELPERCGRVVAQDSALTTCEHRRHPASVPARSAMPDRVHAAVNAMKAAELHSTGDRALADPHLSKLL